MTLDDFVCAACQRTDIFDDRLLAFRRWMMRGRVPVIRNK